MRTMLSLDRAAGQTLSPTSNGCVLHATRRFTANDFGGDHDLSLSGEGGTLLALLPNVSRKVELMKPFKRGNKIGGPSLEGRKLQRVTEQCAKRHLLVLPKEPNKIQLVTLTDK